MARMSLHEVLSGSRLTQQEFEQELPRLREQLLAAQIELRERKDRAVVLIVTGIPAAGRSEVVNEILEWLDPKLVAAYGFREPNAIERELPPLWRYWRVMPPKGRLAIFFTGWYQDLLQAVIDRNGKSSRTLSPAFRRDAERLLRLERMLVSDGVAVVKVHLHVSPATQAKRLRKLQRDKVTRWRVTAEDRWMSRHYGDVERAFERCLKATEQPAAPWHLVDGTDPQHRALATGRTLLEGMRSPLAPPQPGTRARRTRTRGQSLSSTHRGPALDDQQYDDELERLRGRLALLSRRKKFARHAVVAVFEGMDASGKGGAIRHVTSALDARQYRVVPTAAPTPEEIARPYLWRFWCQLPARCSYAIFDRSWYGRVLVERVRGFAARPDWERAYDEINEFERQLTEHGVIVAKFWLAVSQDEQLERFKKRDRDPLKRFKVDPEDRVNRKHWDAYQVAVKEMLARTGTPAAPWEVVPADDKRHARLAVLRALSDRVAAALD